jgi:hypothetical protein
LDSHNVAKRAHRVLEIAAEMARKLDGPGKWRVQNRIEEIQLHFDGYAEPGYTDPECGIVATGNWNKIDDYNKETNKHDLVSDLPGRIFDIFEKMGIEGEWSDEWSECTECNKLVRTSPDSYSWQRSYWFPEDSGEIICRECVKNDPEEYLRAHEGCTTSCITIDEIDPADHDYVKVNEDSYESGWHPGQTDDPKTVAAWLHNQGVKRFLFRLDSVGQFDSRWSVYVHKDEDEYLKECDEAANEPEPAENT